MPRAVRQHLAVAACYARLTVQSQLEQPSSLLIWSALVPLHWLTGVYALRRLTVSFDSLAGWNQGEITFLYGLALLSHALTILFFCTTWGVAEWASRGRFADLQTRPLNVYFHFACSAFNLIGLFDLGPAVAILIYGCRETAFRLDLRSALWLLLLTVAGVLFRVGVCTAVGSLAFWTQRSQVGLAAAAIERTTMYPLTVYPGWLQLVLTVVLPVAFVAFIPARDALRLHAGEGSWATALLALLVGAITFAVGYGVFSAGVARGGTSGS
jgi:ABC-2 type transport system permease protein